VTVNGEIVTELGTKADPDKDHIKVRGRLINNKLKTRPNVYILLNKPKGYLQAPLTPRGESSSLTSSAATVNCTLLGASTTIPKV
jgi:23S rRNA pseudouridine2605 synthase